MTNTIQRHNMLWFKPNLWLSLYFTQHRQTQPLKACPHLNQTIKSAM